MSGTGPKPFVFVLMPFASNFDDIYNLGIESACKDAGTYCERVDKQIFTESILERVYNQIHKCDIIIADMSGKNPNVFYEVGYAHAINKRTILVTNDANDIPFDLKHFPHIVYNNSISSLKNELTKRIKYFIENPDKGTPADLDALEVHVQGQNVELNPLIFINNWPAGPGPHPGQIAANRLFSITIRFCNKSKQVLDTFHSRFAFVFPKGLGHPEMGAGQPDRGPIDKENFIYFTNSPRVLMPSDWHLETVTLKAPGEKQLDTLTHMCEIRVLNEFNNKIIKFHIITQTQD
jgi:hypothetical protein